MELRIALYICQRQFLPFTGYILVLFIAYLLHHILLDIIFIIILHIFHLFMWQLLSYQLPYPTPLTISYPLSLPCFPPLPIPPRDDTLGFSQFAFCIWPEESFALLSLLLLLLFCFLFKLYSKLLFKWQMVFCASPPPPHPASCPLSAAHLLCRRGSCGGIGTCHKPFVNRQPDWIPWLSAVAKPEFLFLLFFRLLPILPSFATTSPRSSQYSLCLCKVASKTLKSKI